MTKLGIAACALVLATSAYGQADGVPPDLAAKIAALGRVIDPPKTAVHYAARRGAPSTTTSTCGRCATAWSA